MARRAFRSARASAFFLSSVVARGARGRCSFPAVVVGRSTTLNSLFHGQYTNTHVCTNHTLSLYRIPYTVHYVVTPGLPPPISFLHQLAPTNRRAATGLAALPFSRQGATRHGDVDAGRTLALVRGAVPGERLLEDRRALEQILAL